MDISDQGFMRPTATGALPRDIESRILKVCPGRQLVGPANPSAGGINHRIFGHIRHLAKGYACDAETRYKAATGGVLSALATYLVESGRVEGVLQVGVSRHDPLRNEARFNSRREDIIAAAGSRYGPAAPLADILEVLASGRRFAFVGKPCDVAALRALAQIDPRVNRQVPYMLAMFCGAVPSIHSTYNIIRRHGVEPDDVSEFRYRGHGWPGPTHVGTRDGRVFQQSYDESWFSEMSYDLMFRCKICPDGIGEHADVVAGDCWEMEQGAPVHREKSDGWNFHIGRTSRGVELLRSAIAAGYISEQSFAIDELEAMHDDHAYRKRSVLWRLLGLVLTGQPFPRYHRMRVVVAGLLESSWRERWEGLSGVIRRVQLGKNRESGIASHLRG